MFTVEVIGDKAVIARMDALSAELSAAMESTTQRLALILEARVRAKLQGQVLQHRTGKLSASIDHEVTTNPDGVLGRVFSNGTVKYAAIHEFGFDGTETVRSHERRQTQVFGHPIDPIIVTVGAFDRVMHMPERSFMRSTLTESAAEIEKAYTDAVAKALGAT